MRTSKRGKQSNVLCVSIWIAMPFIKVGCVTIWVPFTREAWDSHCTPALLPLPLPPPRPTARAMGRNNSNSNSWHSLRSIICEDDSCTIISCSPSAKRLSPGGTFYTTHVAASKSARHQTYFASYSIYCGCVLLYRPIKHRCAHCDHRDDAEALVRAAGAWLWLLPLEFLYLHAQQDSSSNEVP